MEKIINWDSKKDKTKVFGIVHELEEGMSTWKKDSKSRLPRKKDGSLEEHVDEEMMKNKYRKNYFQFIISSCEFILMHLSDYIRTPFRERIKNIVQELQTSKDVSEEQVDEVDKVAKEIIKEAKKYYGEQ